MPGNILENKSQTIFQKICFVLRYHFQSARLLFTIVIISLGPMICGVSLGFSSSVSAQLILSDNLLAFFSSVINLGALIGSLLVGPLLNSRGRRLTLIISSIPALIGWLMISGAQGLSPPATPTNSLIGLLLMGRVLTGVAAGMLNAVGSVFLVEVAPPAHRGRIGSLGQCAIVVGISLAYAGGIYKTWYEVAQLMVVGSFCLIILAAIYLPESPVWLARSNQENAALIHLSWLRADIKRATEELAEIFDDNSDCDSPPSSPRKKNKVIDNDLSTLTKSPKNTSYRVISIIFPCLTIPRELNNSLRVAIALMVGQQMTGVNVITFYTEPLCQQFVDISKSAQCAFSLGLAQVIFSVIASLLIDRFPRRLLVVTTGVIMTVSMLLFALGKEFPDNAFVSPIVSLIFFLFGYCCGWGPLAMLITMELFPVPQRGAAGGAAVAISWIASFLVTQSFAPLKQAVGEFTTFALFAGLTGAFSVYFYRYLPETNRAYFLPANVASSRAKLTRI